jgi:hypothetical protein
MRLAVIAATALVLTGTVALAQNQSTSRPAIGIGSKTMASCTNDQKKFCAGTPEAVMKECLVKNWTRIASDCQDALATPVNRINPRR